MATIEFNNPTPFEALVRRVVDVVVGCSVLVVSAPALLVAAVAIRVDGPGSIFYRAERIGERGRRFRMWKFRTMVPDADALGPSVTAGRDSRVTRVGKVLRGSKVDELPQFWNVVVGDMTLVGPRPEAPDLAERYTTAQKRILVFTPGVTSPGTLQYAKLHEASIPEGQSADEYYLTRILDPKIEADLSYLSRRTLGSDAGVIFETVRYVLGRALSSIHRRVVGEPR